MSGAVFLSILKALATRVVYNDVFTNENLEPTFYLELFKRHLKFYIILVKMLVTYKCVSQTALLY